MIDIDYSILLSLQFKVQDVKSLGTDFQVQLAQVNRQSANAQELIFRSDGGKNFLLSSEEVTVLEEVEEGIPVVRRRLVVKGVREALKCTFVTHLQNPRLERFISWPRNPSNLPSLADYSFLKPIYFIDNQRLEQNQPLDKEDLIGLAPVFMRFLTASAIKIRESDTQRLISPIDTDSQYDQYDLSNSIPGIYTIERASSNPLKIYINPLLANPTPLAVLQLSIPKGAVSRKDYSIEFKNKL